MPGLLASRKWNPAVASVYTFNNQTITDPVMSKVDGSNLVLPTFTTGATGRIGVYLSCHIISTASAADNHLKWALLDVADAVVLPNDIGAAGSRRVALHNEISRRAKIDAEFTLDPNTTYTLYWGAGCGNQVPGGGGGKNFLMKAGGTFGPAVMLIWGL